MAAPGPGVLGALGTLPTEVSRGSWEGQSWAYEAEGFQHRSALILLTFYSPLAQSSAPARHCLCHAWHRCSRGQVERSQPSRWAVGSSHPRRHLAQSQSPRVTARCLPPCARSACAASERNMGLALPGVSC